MHRTSNLHINPADRISSRKCGTRCCALCILLLALPTNCLAHWDAFALQEAPPRYRSLSEIYQSARRGELPVGQRILLAVAQSPESVARAAELSSSTGTLFCVQPTALHDLPAGVWPCEIRPDRRLWPSAPTTVPYDDRPRCSGFDCR